MQLLTLSNFAQALEKTRRPYQANYYAFYSSLWDAVTLDPALMMIPVDDHMAHRGDGVFETFKCVNGAAYLLEAHLSRLLRSAAAIGITFPGGKEAIREKVLAVMKTAAKPDCSVRVLLSRGPGSFGADPASSIGSVLYIAIYALGRPFMLKHPEGARVCRSRIAQKPSDFVIIKTCNYLPNALMKEEARLLDVDFTVGFDDKGFMTEGAVENFGIVSKSGRLTFPPLDTILPGTTMLRAADLAQHLEEKGLINGVTFQQITYNDMLEAREILIVGTTLNAVAVVQFEGRTVGTGKPGPVWEALNRLLVRDIEENATLRTPFM